MKTRIALLSLALSLCLASTVAFTVSCEKSGVEDEPKVGETVRPTISPKTDPNGNEFTIMSDGTTISNYSLDYSFIIKARAITFQRFNCHLTDRQFIEFPSSCNLTLNSDSHIKAINMARIDIGEIKLSGRGSITISRPNSNFTYLKSHISAEEGYTVTVSDVITEDNLNYSCKWTVKKK